MTDRNRLVYVAGPIAGDPYILPHGTSFSVPRGTRVRVVAAPTGDPTEDDR